MSKSHLFASTAIAALLCALPAMAQEQKKNDATPQATHPSQQGTTPGASSQPHRNDAQRPGATAPGNTAQGQSKDMNKGTANKPDTSKGHAQNQPEHGNATQKGTNDKGSMPKASANDHKGTQPKASADDKTTRDKSAATPSSKDTSRNAETNKGMDNRKDMPKEKSASDRTSDQGRIQLSEQQRTDVHRDILKERNVNRVKNVHIDVHVGKRVPRTLHLAALPASVVTLVPAYRSYRYFVVGDEICIVEPSTYEIVDVISSKGTVAQNRGSATHAGLTLSAQERQIVLREVDLKSGDNSTLGLGAISEGSPVPRNVEIIDMPMTVVERVPKLDGYKYFVAEQRVAIVDPRAQRIELVIEAHSR